VGRDLHFVMYAVTSKEADLIEYNIIHLRPAGMCSYNVPSSNEAIVTPESSCGRFAIIISPQR